MNKTYYNYLFLNIPIYKLLNWIRFRIRYNQILKELIID